MLINSNDISRQLRLAICFILSYLAIPAPAFAARSLVVLPVYEQPAGDLVEVLRPLLGRGSSITAHGNQLIVNASTSELHAIREALLRLDQPARQLLIEVRQARDQNSQDTRGTVRYYRTNDLNDSIAQRVQTLDGRPALIRSGEVIPTMQYQLPWYPARDPRIPPPPLTMETTYQAQTAGFYALPRLHGDQVTIELYQWNERPELNGNQHTQQATTTVRGHLGTWLNIGAVNINGEWNNAGGQQHWSTQQQSDMQLQLRVTELPQ
ncbi:hypothetical protein HUU61_00085 [Rhodopseudomonas palustris]|uniref:NolW-like domain-containing protein n=1 Tax=Thiospirillum jenense TaxID=1653858 RepID=A0A839HBE2_9GAMM|nr:secretin N-terminal domain-containing protein [Thiospirillum jenense]MBB1089676.1 hypothetical protein [Rhodopseudomonas palustris]MBB1124776.1 hypothetical protein [Thiospirillum jenense]